MKTERLVISDVLLFTPKVHRDQRGYFLEAYRQQVLDEALGRALRFIQDNESQSSYGVVRGLHYQLPPYAQNKLVRVVAGRVLDVIVDLRKSSATFGQSCKLNWMRCASNRRLSRPGLRTVLPCSANRRFLPTRPMRPMRQITSVAWPLMTRN